MNRGERMTKNKRCSFMITPNIEEKIREMRKSDAYCMMSVSEIIRMLCERGLEQIKSEQ